MLWFWPWKPVFFGIWGVYRTHRGAKQASILANDPDPAPLATLPPTPGPSSVSSISSPSTGDSGPLRASIPAQAPPARARIEPTSEARYRIQLNASWALKEFRSKR
jgi:hypothetical protein